MSKHNVQDMFDGETSPEVKHVQETVMDFMSDKGNHICNRCGTDLVPSSSCLICPKCGFSDCGE